MRTRVQGMQSTNTNTKKLLLLQLNVSYEYTRRHPRCPRRKPKNCVPRKGNRNELPRGRSWQGATAPAVRHMCRSTAQTQVTHSNQRPPNHPTAHRDLRTHRNQRTHTHSPSQFPPPRSCATRPLARQPATPLSHPRRPHSTLPTRQSAQRGVTTIEHRATCKNSREAARVEKKWRRRPECCTSSG